MTAGKSTDALHLEGTAAVGGRARGISADRARDHLDGAAGGETEFPFRTLLSRATDADGRTVVIYSVYPSFNGPGQLCRPKLPRTPSLQSLLSSPSAISTDTPARHWLPSSLSARPFSTLPLIFSLLSQLPRPLFPSSLPPPPLPPLLSPPGYLPPHPPRRPPRYPHPQCHPRTSSSTQRATPSPTSWPPLQTSPNSSAKPAWPQKQRQRESRTRSTRSSRGRQRQKSVLQNPSRSFCLVRPAFLLSLTLPHPHSSPGQSESGTRFFVRIHP